MAVYRNKMASQHNFAMIPRSDIPRSKYMLQQTLKTSMNASNLVPIHCEEMLPGDHFNGHATIFARLATPITPVLDNAELETFFFFVPNRLVWDNWEEFIAGGNFTIPQIISPTGGFPDLGIYDYFGLPPASQTTPGQTTQCSALPLRAYNKIFNEWFRDQNLTPALGEETDDGPDTYSDYDLQNRAKKHDYFTSCLPWPQKGTAVSLPLGTTAPVSPQIPGSSSPTFRSGGAGSAFVYMQNGAASNPYAGDGAGSTVIPPAGIANTWNSTGLVADLSAATAATINALRTAFQVQRMLERDARGGTRYIEQLQSHFGVRPPDFRLQRPEYIGGGRTPINTFPIAQTSETGTETPQGNLAGFTTAQGGGHRFQYAATEHGYIIGLAQVRTDLTYQQGMRRHWSRVSRYDFAFPTLAHLGEQAVLRKEIFSTGVDVDDNTVFGYQERYAEYRYTPNQITGMFRSTNPNTIDVWHYAEEFATPPGLNNAFIIDPSFSVLNRSMAVHEEAAGQQILMDVLFRTNATRPLPTYSVPGLIDHF